MSSVCISIQLFPLINCILSLCLYYPEKSGRVHVESKTCIVVWNRIYLIYSILLGSIDRIHTGSILAIVPYSVPDVTRRLDHALHLCGLDCFVIVI